MNKGAGYKYKNYPDAEQAVPAQLSAPTQGYSGGMPDMFRTAIVSAAKAVGVDPADLYAIAKIESNFNPKAVSHVGAEGGFQFMPGTQKQYGLDDPYDVNKSALAAAKYIKNSRSLYGDDDEKVSASYNAGPGNVNSGKWKSFPETTNYVKKFAEAKLEGQKVFGSSPASQASTSGSDAGAMASAEPGKKKSSLLPLLFRFVLPAVAGGVMGGQSPFMGAGAGMLGALASSGLGYMKSKDNESLYQQKNAFELAKNKQKQTEFDARLGETSDYHSNMVANAKERNDIYRKSVTNSLEGKDKPSKQQALFTYVGEQFGGEPINVDNIDEMKRFAQSLEVYQGDNTFTGATKNSDGTYIDAVEGTGTSMSKARALAEQYNRTLSPETRNAWSSDAPSSTFEPVLPSEAQAARSRATKSGFKYNVK